MFLKLPNAKTTEDFGTVRSSATAVGITSAGSSGTEVSLWSLAIFRSMGPKMSWKSEETILVLILFISQNHCMPTGNVRLNRKKKMLKLNLPANLMSYSMRNYLRAAGSPFIKRPVFSSVIRSRSLLPKPRPPSSHFELLPSEKAVKAGRMRNFNLSPTLEAWKANPGMNRNAFLPKLLRRHKSQTAWKDVKKMMPYRRKKGTIRRNNLFLLSVEFIEPPAANVFASYCLNGYRTI